MDDNPNTPALTAPLAATVAPRSMVVYGVLCFLVLLAYLFVVAWAQLQLGLNIPRLASIGGLLVAIHFSAWRSVRASGRDMLPVELTRFLLACFAAFWLMDEVPVLIRHILAADSSLPRVLAKAFAATLVDLVIVAIIVMSTVPSATRAYSRRAIA